LIDIRRLLKQILNQILNPLGIEIRKLPPKIDLFDGKVEGFPGYVAEADKIGMDVNDWLEKILGWAVALPVLEQTVFPYIQNESVVCELGAGLGRHARHIAPRLSNGALYLVDHSSWTVAFLQKYFQSNHRVSVHLCNGHSLPFQSDSWVDLIFSNGTFIELKLGLFYLYSREFFRILKPGGYCVFDYIDPTTMEGYKYLESTSAKYIGTYTYHAPEVVDKIFISAGFEIIKRNNIGKSTYLITRKLKPASKRSRQ
jgi:ubiquinone/menaquinone biosynthesis C-methylase UbiE